MKKRKVLLVLGFVIILAVVGFAVVRNMEQGLLDLIELPVGEVDFSVMADGTYGGKYRRFPVAAEVTAVVEDGILTEIKLLNHSHGPGYGDDAILNDVLANQSLQVDLLSGATYSSVVVLKAIEMAFVD